MQSGLRALLVMKLLLVIMEPSEFKTQSNTPEVVKDTGASFVLNPRGPEDGRTVPERLCCSNGSVFLRHKLS